MHSAYVSGETRSGHYQLDGCLFGCPGSVPASSIMWMAAHL